MQVYAWDPERNLKWVEEMAKKTPKWWLLILPEMCIPWYMIWDRWLRDSFVKECREINQRIIQILDENGIAWIWGNIDIDERKKNEDGSIRKYNTAFISQNWKLLGKVHKTLLPNYRMFDDKRYFTSLQTLAKEEQKPLEQYYKPIEIEINWVITKVSVLICEDIWNINGDYNIDPVKLTRKHSPDLIAVPSASPFGLNKFDMRNRILKKASRKGKLAYVNPIWQQNNWKNVFIFEWGSSIYENWKKLQWIKDYTKEENATIDEEKNELEQILETSIYYIREYMKNISQEKVVIWLSGWIDSALSAALCTIALWSKNVFTINMPSKFNSKTTKNLAQECAQKLWVEYKIFPIQESIDLKIKQITQTSWKAPTDFEIENIQARERWQILADMASNIWAVFTNNGNKDEIALWYATLYWDVAWAFCVLWDLYKTQVYELSKYINKKYGELIPQGIIDIVPSAELSDKQDVESWNWDPFNYEFTSKLNQALIEKKKEPADILDMYLKWELKEFLWIPQEISSYFENENKFIEEIEKIWNLLNINYFKRVQSPPILTISKSSFWFEYREAQNPVYFWEKYKKLKNLILKQ